MGCGRQPALRGAAAAALLAALAAGAVGPSREEPAELLERARAALAVKDHAAAVELLRAALRRESGTPETHEQLGTALLELARADEAAHHLEQALRGWQRLGRANRAKAALALLRRADPLSSRRDLFLDKITSTLTDSAAQLHKEGSLERALQLLERLAPCAQGKDAARAAELLAKVRAAFERVDLDRQALERPESGGWPLHEIESAHYRFACHLEPPVVQRLAGVMDDIHAYYVRIYFDGDERAAASPKARIRILPDRETMLAEWGGGGSPGGWWSPGGNEVVSYDTRTTTGSLDELLATLFHEASHQFTTLLSKGGSVPAWLNEGTASFFEGAVAMADGRVLWPSAAAGRLWDLCQQFGQPGAPTAAQVVGWPGQGSYEGAYYAWGWGLVYFLQQYEDPRTLEYVYRPLYARYRAQVISKGGDPMGVFQEVFLGRASPLGHATFEDFAAGWQRWITGHVRPLEESGPRARELRLARASAYLAAADLARAARKPPAVGEQELLLRALGDLEHVRTRLERPEAPDGELLLTQAGVLERLGRGKSAAALIEQALELSDGGRLALAEERKAELEKRLSRLDSRSAALRGSRQRVADLARAARGLLADYRASRSPELVLRSYTFAQAAGSVLQDAAGLLACAGELRAQARERGLLLGTVRALRAPRESWTTVFSTPPERFEPAGGIIELECVRASGWVDSSLDVSGEYELRARIVPPEEPDPGAACGLVVSAPDGGDWTLAGIDEHARLGLWLLERTGNGGTRLRRLPAERRAAPADASGAPGEPPGGARSGSPAGSPAGTSAGTSDGTSAGTPEGAPGGPGIELTARVALDGTLELRAGGTETLVARLAVEAAAIQRAGVWAKNTRASFHGLTVEIAP